jgi:uncharacterized membrane protein YgdD (TMEM256/DUF423 family)
MRQIIAILGILAVGLGAFGAHTLKPLLSDLQQETFKTASFYHFIHLLAMFILYIWDQNHDNKVLKRSFYLFLAGILCFSGSLYILSTKDLLLGNFWSLLGPVTPIGGLLLILGWANLLIAPPTNGQSSQYH